MAAVSVLHSLIVLLSTWVAGSLQLTVYQAEQLPLCNSGACSCGREYVPDQKVMLSVTCGLRDPVSQIPDWSDLARVRANVSINLRLKKFPERLTLRREDFPVGLPVKIVTLSGLTREMNVTRNVFENVRFSLTGVALSGYVDGPLTLLGNLPRLESLTLNVGSSKHWSEGLDTVVLSQSLFKGVPGLKQLKLLELFGQNIAEIGPEVFEGLGVETVHLYLAKLREFPGSALRRVENLKVLFVYSNNITHLKNGALDGMVLEQLDFPECRLGKIDPEALVGVKDSLKQLYLRGGNLDSIPDTALSPLRHLEACSLVEMEGEAVVNVSKSFAGRYCLKKLYLSFKHLQIQPDAFEGQEDCIRELYVKSSSLDQVPTEALASLRNVQVVELKSTGLSNLSTGAFAGFHGKRIVIDAPLTRVETGAFQDMERYPMVLHLEAARLRSLDFFHDYPPNTFSSIGLGNTQVQCDCRLAEVNLNLGKYNYTVGGYVVPGYVSGECVLEGRQVGTYLKPVRDAFSSCMKNVTIVDPPLVGPSQNGSGSSQSEGGPSSGCDVQTPLSASLVGLVSLMVVTSWSVKKFA